MRELPDPPRIDALIRWAARELSNSPTPMIDARALAKAAFELDHTTLIAEGSRQIDAARLDLFVSMVARRGNDEPVAYIVGRREFWSLEFGIEPGILVPRADSETLIDAVAKRRDRRAAASILDLGCGSGALLCALLSEFPKASGLGVDINPRAVSLTNSNIASLGFSSRARAVEGDWLDATGATFDIIVSNPPYIRTGDREFLPREVREFESPLALFAGPDGLAAYRTILEKAPARLAEDGLMVLECGEGQAGAVNEIATSAFPGAQFAVENDLAGRPRALVIDLRAAAH